MEKRKGKLILSVITMLFSMLSTGISFGILGELQISFFQRFLCGFCFLMPPILLIHMINALLRENL